MFEFGKPLCSEMHAQFLSGSPNDGDCLEDLGMDEKMVLNIILGKWGVKVSNRLNWPTVGSVSDFCECSIEPLSYIKVGNFLAKLVTIRLS